MKRTQLFFGVTVVFGLTTQVHAQHFPNQFDPRGPNLHLPLAGLNQVQPGGALYAPPLPGTPLGGVGGPYGFPGAGMPFNRNNTPAQNNFGAMTPWPFQNPFTPSTWNFAFSGPFMNPWAASGMWAGPPFGQYGFNGYGNFAPIVGVNNNGWWPYDNGFNGFNGWGMPGFSGNTPFNVPTNPMLNPFGIPR